MDFNLCWVFDVVDFDLGWQCQYDWMVVIVGSLDDSFVSIVLYNWLGGSSLLLLVLLVDGDVVVFVQQYGLYEVNIWLLEMLLCYVQMEVLLCCVSFKCLDVEYQVGVVQD